MNARARLILAIAALAMLSLITGCTPTASHPGSGQPPAAGGGADAGPDLPGGAILVIQTYDLKTGVIIPPNERDYPLKVIVSIFNHDNEQAVGFPEHLLVARNPWTHTVEWPQVDQFDRAEADVLVPHKLVPGVGIVCQWTDLGEVIYAGTKERAQPGGAFDGSDGTVCILLSSMLRH